MCELIFVIGPTNAGKSTLLSAAKASAENNVALVEVGKILRAKYSPEHFKGLGNPKHTAGEAWDIMVSTVDKAVADGFPIVLVDGQPRDLEQLHSVLTDYCKNPLYRVKFLHLWAPLIVREERARLRDQHDPAKLELSLARMKNDPLSLYEIVTELQIKHCTSIKTVNTSRPDFNPVQCVFELTGPITR